MNKAFDLKRTIIIISSFIWIGMVVAISFMEAWLKFRAPGVSIEIGVGIGRLVFNALNKMEWLLATIIILSVVRSSARLIQFYYLYFMVALSILVIQSFWVLPLLDVRARSIMAGNFPQPSNLHTYFVIMEFIKVVSLIIFGIHIINQKNHIK